MHKPPLRTPGLFSTHKLCEASVMGTQVNFNNPDIKAKLEQWASQTGRPAGELVEGVMAAYFEEMAQVRQTLDSRYDDIKTGKVTLSPGDEVASRLRERSAAYRLRHP